MRTTQKGIVANNFARLVGAFFDLMWAWIPVSIVLVRSMDHNLEMLFLPIPWIIAMAFQRFWERPLVWFNAFYRLVNGKYFWDDVEE
jgi:hypothetical protein